MGIVKFLMRHYSRLIIYVGPLLLLVAVFTYLTSDVAAQILSEPVDSDGDGVPDSTESQDKTNPNSADSLIEQFGSRYCVDWNGFLNDNIQIMELRNAGCSTLELQVTLRDSEGSAQNNISLTLQPTEQFDLIANTLSGFQPMTYGNLCANIQSGDPNTLDVRMSNYRTSENSFDSALSTVVSPSRIGSQFINYNNFFPTLNSSELANHVSSWVQISNDESATQSGQLISYGTDGKEIKRVNISIPARGRLDYDVLSLVEDSVVGSMEWSPNSSTKKFRVVLTRYYHSAGSESNFSGMISLPAKRPSGTLLASSFQTDSRISVLEVTNTLDIDVSASFSVYDAAGNLTPSQPSTVSIPANGTYHLILNNFMESGVGKIQFSSNEPKSLITSLLEYGLDNSSRFKFVTMSEPKAGFGITQRSSYNNFLGGCRLRVTNLSNVKRSTEVDVYRYDGTRVPFTSPIQVSAHSVLEQDLCSSDTQGNYGSVTLTPFTTEALVGEVVRENVDKSVEFRTTAVERSICTAELKLNTPSVSLIAGSENSETLSITNTSTAVTAVNIQAKLPDAWNDVLVDATNCETLAPGETCQISITPGNMTHASASVSLVGNNTSELLPTVSVVAPLTAVLTVTGSPLTLTTNGPSGSLTINNTSVTTAALNVTSDFTSTALDGNVTESGNTCAKIPASGSCTLTYTPENTVVPATNFTVQGSNTNSTTAQIEIESSSQLVSVNQNSGTASGGTGITLTGTGLVGATSVTFDGIPATSVNVVNSTTITAVTPAHAPGEVDVVVDTPGGGATLTNGYTYVATAVGQSSSGGTIACLNGGLNNLIAATADNSASIEWGGLGTEIGVTVQSETDGAFNTAAIVTALGNNGGTPYAAQICNNYEVDSQGNIPCQAGNTCYNDWFLPAGFNTTASGQLHCLYNNRNTIGGFADAVYLTSTEFKFNPALDVWVQSFFHGIQTSVVKDTTARARCVRAFTP